MRVKRLEVKNFRGIRELTLEFPERVTVLVGANGSGKSSILDALRVMLGHLMHAVLLRITGMKGIDGWSALRAPVEIEASDLRVDERFVSLTLKAQVGTQELKWSIVQQETVLGTLMTSEKRVFEPEEDIQTFAAAMEADARKDPELSLPLAVYYSASQGMAGGANGEPGKPANQLTSYASALDGSSIASVKPFISWFRSREDYENEQKVEQALLGEEPDFNDPQIEAVRQVTKELLPGFSDLRMRRQPERMVIRKGRIELELNQLSGGERYLLALAGDIARRLALANPGSPEPRLCSAVILIDEIESHLHPAWQRRVIPALERAFPNCQFIVTTHSPQVLSEVWPESIYLLRQENGELRVERPSASYGRDSNRILEDLMEADERPPEVKHKLQEYFKHIAVNNMDEARKLRRELEVLIGPDEPEFTRADAIIRARELLSSETDQ